MKDPIGPSGFGPGKSGPLEPAPQHNREISFPSQTDYQEEALGVICILVMDGRLFGPFPSRSLAKLWCEEQGLTPFSTYDLIPQSATDV